jgi:acetyl-CoA carboxylase alpha subunit
MCSISGQRINKHNTEIERLKTIKDSTINKKFIEINTLERQIEKLDNSITQYVEIIDSIENAREKVKIVYKIKYKEIEQFNDTLLINYWENQFDNE